MKIVQYIFIGLGVIFGATAVIMATYGVSMCIFLNTSVDDSILPRALLSLATMLVFFLISQIFED